MWQRNHDMLDPREQQKNGFRAFAQRDAQRREDREAAQAAAVDAAADHVPATDATDATKAPVYGLRLVKDTPAR